LGISRQAVYKSAEARNGQLLMWIFGREGKPLREYDQVYIDFGWDAGAEDAYQWQGSDPADLIGSAVGRYQRSRRKSGEEKD
jgi:hypothetical protein